MQRRRLALLAVLAAAPSGRVSRDKLVGILWPDETMAHARHFLADSIYSIRAALGRDAILTDGDDVILNPDAVTTDVGEFEAFIAADELERAIRLYHAPFVEGFYVPDAPDFERWAERERSRLGSRAAGAIESLASRAEAGSDFAAASEWWRKLAALDPCNSRIALRLMRALANAGDPGSAIQHARAHQKIVRDELGAEPAAEIGVFVRTLQSSPSIAPAAAGLQRQVEASAAPLAATGPTGGATTSAPPLPATPTSMEAKPPARGLAIGVAAGFLFIVIVGATLSYEKIHRSSANESVLANDAERISSVAVLPFANVGGDPADEYLSEGITDELANALSKFPGMRVASRTSAYSFRKIGAEDVKEIGKKLNVRAVVEGTVRHSGDRLRVTAQLTNIADGLAVWSEGYERHIRDVFDLEDDISSAIASSLQRRLTSGASPGAVQGTQNLHAYDLYLRGRYLWNARGAENLRRAASYFDSAIAADPRFARAYAALAMTEGLLPEYTDSPPGDALERTRTAASRALALDSTLAEAHTALGVAAVHAWEWANAESEYKKAIGLDPRFPTAHQWYGELLYQTARLDSSIAETKQAAALDPLAPITAAAVGYSLTVAGRYAEAIAVFKQGIELAPSLGVLHATIAAAYLFSGDSANAVREAETAARLDPELMLRRAQLAYVYAMTGQRSKAAQLVASMEHPAAGRYVSPGALAIAYIGLGEKDKALISLERGVATHDISLLTGVSLLPDPTFDPLRTDPRFLRVVTQMNLTQFVNRAAKPHI
ncbi:MAG: BTAD domain-containing putative transcriptional regulator [Gemmatimonadaceae bacterium]